MDTAISEARPGDLPEVLALLRDADLPLEGVAEHFGQFLVVRANERVVGAAGLELYGEAALLRSVVIHAEWRGRRLGERVTEAALARARAKGIREVYLFTKTAAGFFPRFGFQPIPREAMNPAVKASVQFQTCCTANEVSMALILG